MTTVTVLPSNVEFPVHKGHSLMECARAAGLYWPTTCGGQGLCTTCMTEVVDGGEHLLEMSRNERKTLVAERGEGVLGKPLRLACQAILTGGPVIVEKAGVRRALPPL